MLLPSNSTFAATVAKWRARHDEAQRLGMMVSGATICAEVLADLDAIATAHDDEALTLAEAAAESGYSAEHLRRLIREGKIPNAGRRHAPRVRRADLPRKAATVLPLARRMRDDTGATRADLVRAVIRRHE